MAYPAIFFFFFFFFFGERMGEREGVPFFDKHSEEKNCCAVEESEGHCKPSPMGSILVILHCV